MLSVSPSAMQDPLEATFYQDDFLTRTLTTSVLYDKSKLALSIVDNNNGFQKFGNITEKQCTRNSRADHESPNLDFLKMESPDLESMFMTFNDSEDSNISHDNGSTGTVAFNIEGEFTASDNCFADALQLLHDQQDLPAELDLLEDAMKKDSEILVSKANPLEATGKSSSSLPTIAPALASNQSIKPTSTTNILSMKIQNNNSDLVITTLDKDQEKSPKPAVDRLCDEKSKPSKRPARSVIAVNHVLPNPSMAFGTNMATLSQLAHVNKPLQRDLSSLPTMAPVHISIPEQFALTNQLAMISQVQQLQQQQQEIAFLSQAMGFQSERDVTQQVLSSFPMNQNGHILPHIQQKLLEHQILQDQVNGFPQGQRIGLNNAEAVHHMPIDEATLRMFIENPQLTPISYEMQELIKRERKKLRNRIASSKCRKRKLEREGRLETRVRDLKEKNIELNAVANALKQQVCDLKQRVMDHAGEGCQIMLPLSQPT